METSKKPLRILWQNRFNRIYEEWKLERATTIFMYLAKNSEYQKIGLHPNLERSLRIFPYHNTPVEVDVSRIVAKIFVDHEQFSYTPSNLSVRLTIAVGKDLHPIW